MVYLKGEKVNNRIINDNIVNLKVKEETFKKPKEVTPYYVPTDENDLTLVFESRFESGNLFSVCKKEPFEYILVLQNDTNTTGYCQWFFFRISNTRANTVYNFNIINLVLTLNKT